jgi:hypothetical protein
MVERESATTSGEDQHPGADQFIANMGGWAGVPRPGSDACSLRKDVVTAIGNLAQLLNGFIEVAALRGVTHRRAVKSDVEKPVLSGHAPMYRTLIRFR